MRSIFFAITAGLFLSLVEPGSLLAANGSVVALTGNVETRIGAREPVKVSLNQRIDNGMTVTTGENSNAVLRFDDGQVIVLNQNTSFLINNFHYDANKPADDTAIFSIIKGALRAITGSIGQRNKQAFRLIAPQATIGIRGTEFMVALVNPMYLTVPVGQITATNTAGTVGFGTGTTGVVSSSTVLPASISFSALPAQAAAAFSQLSSIAVPAAAGAGAGAAGGVSAGTATGATGVTAGTAVGVGAGIGAAVAAGVAATGGFNTTTTHH
jgi:hypothetical protein